MIAKSCVVLERAIEEGIEAGYRRAFKHIEKPTGDAIKESIFDYVMLEIGNYFTFSDDEQC